MTYLFEMNDQQIRILSVRISLVFHHPDRHPQHEAGASQMNFPFDRSAWENLSRLWMSILSDRQSFRSCRAGHGYPPNRDATTFVVNDGLRKHHCDLRVCDFLNVRPEVYPQVCFGAVLMS